jgi:hypothetical protein
LWLPDFPPTHGSPRNNRNIIFVFAVAAALLIVATTIVFAVTRNTSSESEDIAATRIPCEADNSEERAVCSAVDRRMTAVMDGDFDIVRELTCERDLQEYGALFEISDGTMFLTDAFDLMQMTVQVTDIVISKGTAQITVAGTMTLPDGPGESTTTRLPPSEVTYVKEHGAWKACNSN